MSKRKASQRSEPASTAVKPIKEFYNLEDIQLNYQPETGQVLSSWGNLGCWLNDNQQPINEYPLACAQLAIKLGRVAKLNQLSGDHTVLDTGFGCGDQLRIWREHFNVKQLVGINYSYTQTEHAKSSLEAIINNGPSASLQSHYELLQGDCCKAEAWRAVPKSVNRILALDCLYHFHNKQAYFELCEQHLANDGMLAVSDLLLVKPIHNPIHKLLLRIICKLSSIPFHNLMTLPDYKNILHDQGLELASSSDISREVFLPFGEWLKRYMIQMNLHGNTHQKLTWLKYKGTAAFLRWAHNKQILSYQLLGIIRVR